MESSYLGNIIAFLAVLVGIFGDTWDTNKKGIRKLLPLGWVAITIGIASLSLSSYQINKTQEETDMLRRSAIASLNDPIRKLFIPFEELLLYRDRRYNGKNGYSIMGDGQKDTFFFYLKSKAFLENTDTIRVAEMPFYDAPSLTWEEYFKSHTQDARSMLNNTLAGNGRFLDAKTIKAIDDILADKVFKWICTYEPKILDKDARELGDKESDMNDMLKLYYPVSAYAGYLTKIKILYDIYRDNDPYLRNIK